MGLGHNFHGTIIIITICKNVRHIHETAAILEKKALWHRNWFFSRLKHYANGYFSVLSCEKALSYNAWIKLTLDVVSQVDLPHIVA